MNTIEKFIAETILVTPFNKFVNNINIGNQFSQLSIEEVFLIWYYTGNGYDYLNNALRKHTKEQYFIRFELYLNSALDKLSSYDRLSYRGEKMSEKDFQIYVNDYENARELEILCFYSSTYESSAAEEIISTKAGGKPDYKVIFRIRGKNGKNIENLSQMPDEKRDFI